MQHKSLNPSFHYCILFTEHSDNLQVSFVPSLILSFCTETRKYSEHLTCMRLTMTFWTSGQRGLNLLSYMTKFNPFHKFWQLLPWPAHWLHFQSLQSFSPLCLHGHRLHTSLIKGKTCRRLLTKRKVVANLQIKHSCCNIIIKWNMKNMQHRNRTTNIL